MSQEGFYFDNPDEALKFFEECERRKAVTLEDRMAVVREMVKNKQAKYIRDVDEFAKGKEIIKIDAKEPPIV